MTAKHTPSVYDEKPLAEWPYYRVHAWEEHNPKLREPARFFQVKTDLNSNPKTLALTCADLGVLVRIWVVRALSPRNLPRTPAEARRSLGVAPGKYLRRSLERLERRGFLIPCRSQRRGEERRGEDTRCNTPSKRSARTYPEGFQSAWESYPHFERRSKKAEALKRWRALNLEPLAANVVAAIGVAAVSKDWTKDGGEFVPGFQVWIRGEDFTEPPSSTDNRSKEVRREAKRAEDAKLLKLYDSEHGVCPTVQEPEGDPADGGDRGEHEGQRAV